MKPNHDFAARTETGGGFLFKSGTPQTEIDAIVWKAFQSGDRKAFDFIFQKHIKLLYIYGDKITKDQCLVEDCIQDLFVELWQKREILSPVSNIKFYLLKSLRRRITRRLTSQKLVLTSSPDHDDAFSEVADTSAERQIIERQIIFERQQKLRQALASLSKRQREVIYLKFYEKVPYEELAGIMDVSLKSAYNLVGKAIDSLRKALKA